MTPSDFRRIALSLPDAVESSHFGSPDFRVGGHIFATLAAQKHGYGNLMISPDQQSAFLAEAPNLFLPIKGHWGKQGMTHIILAEADEVTLTGALHTAYQLRIQKNKRPARPKATPKAPKP